MNAPAAGPVNRMDLMARFQEVRAQTERLCAPLAVDDYQVQSVLDYYTAQSVSSSPGRHAARFDELPVEPAAVARTVQNLLIYE